MTQPINEILNRIKNLREFIVNVDIPDGLMLNGVIPYDVSINGTRGRFKIYASSKEEAEQKINEYLEKQQ